MADYIEVTLAAVNNCSKRRLEYEDRHVPGVYSVMVPKGLSDSTMASVALDAFHEECAVSMLDDFEFYVFDPHSQKVLTEDGSQESYTNGHLARDLQRIGDRPPRFYSVSVDVVKADKSVVHVGAVLLAEQNKRSAGDRALRLLWEPWLGADGCKTKIQVEPLRSN